MKLWNGILMGIGVLGLAIFAAPFLLKRILNLGNVTGMVVFLLVFFYGAFRQKVNQWIAGAWSHPAGKVGLLIITLVIVVILILVVIETAWMVGAAVKHPQENSRVENQIETEQLDLMSQTDDEKQDVLEESGADRTTTVVIVLGCRVIGEKPSLMLQERLDAAYSYLTKNPDAVAILSGGKGDDETIAEAECMYRYLTEKGIEVNRLIKEDQSTSTSENIRFSMEIMEEHQLGNNAAIITNEFHEYRAGEFAKEEGLTTTSVPAKTALWLLPTYYVRELYGILYQMIS